MQIVFDADHWIVAIVKDPAAVIINSNYYTIPLAAALELVDDDDRTILRVADHGDLYFACADMWTALDGWLARKEV